MSETTLFDSEVKRLLPLDYVQIADGKDASRAICYTRALLKSALQLAGCKTKIAHKAAKAMFQDLAKGFDPIQAGLEASGEASECRRVVTLERREFESLILETVRSLTANSVAEVDIQIACSVREQRSCVIILMAGTSGTGKSTLASLLAAKMGITTVLSTDSIRHMLRSFSSEEQDPLLWASTYQAGDLIPQLPTSPSGISNPRTEAKIRAIQGYKAQCEDIIGKIARLVENCEARKESMVVEGVHLSINAVVRIMARHPCVVPFLVHISNESKHRERFAVRAKYMTLDAEVNRYVKHFRQIRVIQNYLVGRGERHCIPRVDNTNVDRSVAAIHATVLSFLRRRQRGENILDPDSKTTLPLAEDYQLCLRDAWSSKGMLQLIRSRKSATGETTAPINGHLAATTLAGEEPVGSRGGRSRSITFDLPVLESSDAAAQRAGEPAGCSSGEAELDSSPELRVEGGSIAETEQEDDDHSETVSFRSSRSGAVKRIALQEPGQGAVAG